jgi:hypothetical protein
MPTIQKKSQNISKKRPRDSSVDSDYANFLEKLELFGLGVKSCSAHIERWRFFNAIQDKKQRIARSFLESYKLLECTDKSFDCEGRFTLTFTEKESPKAVLLSVECVYDSHLHSAHLKRDFAERFVHDDSALILRPYARALVTDITARMSIPPVVIPLPNRSTATE